MRVNITANGTLTGQLGTINYTLTGADGKLLTDLVQMIQNRLNGSGLWVDDKGNIIDRVGG
jgi:hypothetical protein